MNNKRPAVSLDDKVFDKCDRFYPKLRVGRCCACCASMWRVRPADHIHHIIRRNCLMLRFELLNLIPLCAECHQKIHDGKLTEPISEQHREWLIRQSNKSFKGVLIARGITKAEFYEEQYQKMKKVVLI